MLNALSDRWRPLFATAIFTGMRRGELLGLRKSDVDLSAGLINIARSHAQGTTKGKRAEAIPIARELIPYLQHALKRSPSELVFPNQQGAMMRPDVALEGVLRRALGRAGIVQGYTHVCRRKDCGYTEPAPDAVQRRYPTHKHLLWPKSWPKTLGVRHRPRRNSIQSRQFCWRPNGDGSKNLRLVVPNPAKRPEPLPPKPPELPRIVRVLELARRWRRILDRGEARTRDDLAKLTGLGSRYVGNILELLRLHPSILEAIERLPVGAGNEVTERWLRPIARLPYDEQLTAVAERLDLGLQEDCG